MIDDHGHPFELEPGEFDLTRVSLDLGERPADGLSPVWRDLLKGRLAAYLGVEAAELGEARQLEAARYPEYVRGLFAEVGITDIMMDPAYPPGAADRKSDLEDLSGCEIHFMFRLESAVDELISKGLPFDELIGRFDDALQAAQAAGYRALKTIIAYRTGLAVSPYVDEGAAARSLRNGEGPGDTKAARDYLLLRALEFSVDHRLPLQIHTGFGDSDVRLSDSNPLFLEPLLDTSVGRRADIVLLHGAFPYHEEAAYLATTRKNVHVDFSLIPIFAPVRLGERLVTLLELAPPEKVLLGTDGHHLPETFWFAALQLGEAWGHVERVVRDAGASPGWLEGARAAVFEDNARRLYGLERSSR